MKNIKKLALTMISACVISLCSGCGSSTPSGWKYDKNDAKDFASYTAKLISNDDKYIFRINEDANTFKASLNKDSLVFFNKTELDEKTKETYYTYNETKQYQVPYETLTVKDDGSGLDIVFDGDGKNSYAALINKNDMQNDQFALAYTVPFSLDSDQVRTQTEFEEQLVSVTPGWDDVEMFINMAGYITQMFLGMYCAVPTAFASGLFGYINVLGNGFFGGGDPTTQDVLDKLDTMDRKLDEISNKIDENQRQLMDEMLLTEAGVDKVLLNQYKADITEYQTQYVLPVENYLAIYKDGIEQALKSYVQSSKTIDFYYAYDTKTNKWEAQSPYVGDVSSYTKYSLNVASFTNATTYLSKHGNIVSDGFVKEFIKDISDSITSIDDYPLNLTKDKLASDIYSTVVDNLNKDFFSDPNRHTEVVNLMTNVKNMANRLAGTTTTSAAESYVERLKMMYNFSGEMREICISLLAALRDQLDGYLEIAQEACKFAEVNCKDMGTAYLAAALKIKHMTDAEKEYDPNYCYFTNRPVYGNYFRSIWEISYTNPGNHPTFHASFKTGVVTNFDTRYSKALTYKEVDIQSLDMMNQTNHKRIYTRYQMLRSLGLTEANDYLDYLVSANIMSKTGYDFWKDMRKQGWVGDDAHRFLTSFEIKDMDDSNKDVGMTCTCYGNPDSEYYYVGWKGKYGQKSDDSEYQYWSGKKAVGDFINASDCSLLKDRRIACYAQYHESHKLWIDDEIFGFIDNPAGAYYFLLYSNNVGY